MLGNRDISVDLYLRTRYRESYKVLMIVGKDVSSLVLEIWLRYEEENSGEIGLLP